MFTNERTKELDRQIKAAGIKPHKPPKLAYAERCFPKGYLKKNTCFRNFLAAMIKYERFMCDPANAEIIMRMRLFNNNFNL